MAKILVVDDSLFQRKKIQSVLAHQGYSVALASHGGEALRLLQLEQIDLLITDLHMPEMDGLTLIRQVRKSHPNIPLLVISSDTQKPVEEECISLGAHQFLEKPLDFNQLATVVTRCLKAS